MKNLGQAMPMAQPKFCNFAETRKMPNQCKKSEQSKSNQQKVDTYCHWKNTEKLKLKRKNMTFFPCLRKACHTFPSTLTRKTNLLQMGFHFAHQYNHHSWYTGKLNLLMTRSVPLCMSRPCFCFLFVNISMKGHVIYGHAIGLLTKNCARELRVLQDSPL